MKLYNLFLDPAKLISAVFILQFIIWYLWMPDVPTIQGAAPRLYSEQAIWRFIILFVVFITFMVIGKYTARTFLKPSSIKNYSSSRLFYLKRIALFSMFLFFIGELVYIRDLIVNPGIIIQAISRGWVAGIGEYVRSQSIFGVTTLINIVLLPIAIYSAIFFHNNTQQYDRRNAKKWLVILGVVMLFNALVLASRMHFIYYLFCITGAYLLFKRPSSGRFTKVVILTVIGFLLVVWLGETFRYGWMYATRIEQSVFSWDVQAYVLQVLVQGYFGSDINNAFALLNWEPSGQYFSSAIFFRTLLESVGYTYGPYYNPYWESIFGTVNVLGLWWREVGWFALYICAFVGFYLGSIYQWAMYRTETLGWAVILFLISFPGVISLTRINYFGLSIFQVPLLCLILSIIIAGILNRKVTL